MYYLTIVEHVILMMLQFVILLNVNKILFYHLKTVILKYIYIEYIVYTKIFRRLRKIFGIYILKMEYANPANY